MKTKQLKEIMILFLIYNSLNCSMRTVITILPASPPYDYSMLSVQSSNLVRQRL